MSGRARVVVVVVVLLAAIACGRVGFDERPGSRDDASTGDGAPGDGTNATIDSPLTNDGPVIDSSMIDAPSVACSGACAYSSNTTVHCNAPCSISCDLGATCNVTCNAVCDVTADNGAVVVFACPGGSCNLHARNGGELSGTCSSGCQMDCPSSAGSPCEQTCQIPVTCLCTGPACT